MQTFTLKRADPDVFKAEFCQTFNKELQLIALKLKKKKQMKYFQMFPVTAITPKYTNQYS